MIYRINNGKKVLVADVSPIRSINGVSDVDEKKNLTLTGADINVGGNGDLKNIKLSDVLKVNDSDKLLSWTVNGLSSDEFKLVYNNGALGLRTVGGDETIGSDIELDLESQIEWIGIVKIANGEWIDFPSEYEDNAPAVTAGDSTNLVVIHQGQTDGSYDVTFADVSDLIDVYTGTFPIEIIGNNISLKTAGENLKVVSGD